LPAFKMSSDKRKPPISRRSVVDDQGLELRILFSAKRCER